VEKGHQRRRKIIEIHHIVETRDSGVEDLSTFSSDLRPKTQLTHDSIEEVHGIKAAKHGQKGTLKLIKSNQDHLYLFKLCQQMQHSQSP
jgi:hypothetical protein